MAFVRQGTNAKCDIARAPNVYHPGPHVKPQTLLRLPPLARSRRSGEGYPAAHDRDAGAALQSPIPQPLTRMATDPKPTRDATWYRWEEMPREAVSAMLDRRLITGDRMMLAHVYLKKGCIVPKHSHENEQFTYIIEGALRFWIGEDQAREVVVGAGEVLHIPSNVPHKAEALEDTLDVDIFDPPRQDWLDKTDSYLRK